MSVGVLPLFSTYLTSRYVISYPEEKSKEKRKKLVSRSREGGGNGDERKRGDISAGDEYLRHQPREKSSASYILLPFKRSSLPARLALSIHLEYLFLIMNSFQTNTV